MAEKPEDLNLPAAVITRMIKEGVSLQRHSIQILVFRVKQNNMLLVVFVVILSQLSYE